MTPETVMTLGRDAVHLVLLLISIVLLPALAMGVLVSVFQAATQINEQTLSFIPKLIVVFLAVLIGGPWMLEKVVSYTSRLYSGIPGLIG